MTLLPRLKSSLLFSSSAAAAVLVCWVLLFAADSSTVVTDELAVTVEEPTAEPLLPPTPPRTNWWSFTGDIMLGRHVETLLRTNGADYVTKYVDTAFATSSGVVINFESAMSEPHTQTPSGAMRFSVASSSLMPLTLLRVTHASLANNHTLDYGGDGYTNAASVLRSHGITPFGHATTLGSTSVTYITQNQQRVAVIGLHTLFRVPTAAEVLALMTEVVAQSDRQVLYVHWGEEYTLVHNTVQERIAAQFVAAGVDLVIGHHPHVTQDIALISGVPVLYSLGNFIFDQYFSVDVEEGYIVDVAFLASSTALQLRPVMSTRSQPRLMDEANRRQFLERLAARSDTALREQIQAGVLVVPAVVLPRTE